MSVGPSNYETLPSWPNNKPKTLGRLIAEYKLTTNPVTNAVRRQIIVNRIDRKELD